MTSPPAPSCGTIDGSVHRFVVRAYFEDTDAGGIVYHANYLRWFERARTELLRALGVGQRETLEAGGGVYVVSDLSIRFLGPARLDDVVDIETRVDTVQRASVRLSQTASIDGKAINNAQVRIGFVGPDGRPRRQPEAWIEKFSRLFDVPERPDHR